MWACEVCTFDNEDSAVCEMCETTKPLTSAVADDSSKMKSATRVLCKTNGCQEFAEKECQSCKSSHCDKCLPSHKCATEPSSAVAHAGESKVAQDAPSSDNSSPDVEHEDFECRVCQELMVDPCTLHCGHTCCRHCLFKWLKASKENAKCPAGCATEISRKLPRVSIVLRTRLQKQFPKEYEQRLASVDASLGDDWEEYKKMDECDTAVKATAQSEDGSLRLLEALLGLQRRVADSRHCSHCRGEAGLCACKSGCALKPTSACIAVHDFECDGCRLAPITGKLFLCSKCDNYGLCGKCYAVDLVHNLEHEFLQLDIRGAPPKRLAARQAYPPTIDVRGAGAEESNGTYVKTNEIMAGTPRYCMERMEDGVKKVYHICKSRSTRTQTIKWWICRTDRAGDRADADKDIDFYTCEVDSMLPPLSGWQLLMGVDPVPSLHFPEGSTESKQPGAGRLKVGDSVMLSDTYLSCSDAAAGPLQPGQTATIWNDAHDVKPYQLVVDGKQTKWWYSEGALQRATAPWSEEKMTEAKNAADYRKKLGLVDQVLQDSDIPEHAKSLLVDEILNLPPGHTSPMFTETERGFQIHMSAVLQKVPEERHSFLLKRIRQDADYSEEEKNFLCDDVISGRHEAVQEKPDGWTINRAALQRIMRERGLPIGRSRVIMHCEHCAGHKALCSCSEGCEKPPGTLCYASSQQSTHLLSQLLSLMGSSSSSSAAEEETPSARSGPTITVEDEASQPEAEAEVEEEEDNNQNEEADNESLPEIEPVSELIPSANLSVRSDPPDLSTLGTWPLSKLKAFLIQEIQSCSDADTLRKTVWDWECASAVGPRLEAVSRVANIEPNADQPTLRESLRAAFPLQSTDERKEKGSSATASQESTPQVNTGSIESEFTPLEESVSALVPKPDSFLDQLD